MRRVIPSILLFSVFALPGIGQQSEVIHLATALNHLTVLEFQEPVTMAAAGSNDFQIERQENKVFIKPMKSGASTNLFVWTPSRRFAYELEPAGEVKNMNFALDNAAPVVKPVTDSHESLDQLADMMLTRAFLGTEQIKKLGSKSRADQVSVSVEQVFRTRNSVYIHYSIENHTEQPYRVSSPEAYQLTVIRPSIALPPLGGTQLDDRAVKKLGPTEQKPLPVAHAESETEDIAAGDTSRGVIAIRQDLSSPTVLELRFPGGVKATLVL